MSSRKQFLPASIRIKMDAVNSTTFIKRPPLMTEKEESMLYTKEILTGRLFIGYYKERRHVSVLNEYRDVIVISPEETDLHRNINEVRKKWTNITDIKWVGITGSDIVGAPKSYCFWVKLENLPFGHYWFQIKRITLVKQEVILQVKYIRKIFAPESAVSSAIQQNHPESYKSNNDSQLEVSTTLTGGVFEFNPRKIFFSLNATLTQKFDIIKPHITWVNFFRVLKIVCALTIFAVLGAIKLAHKIGEYFLKLVRELSILVNAMTPITITIIECLTKIVGGFFVLLAGIFIKRGPNTNSEFYRNNFNSRPYSNLWVTSNNWKERNQVFKRKEFLNRKNMY